MCGIARVFDSYSCIHNTRDDSVVAHCASGCTTYEWMSYIHCTWKPLKVLVSWWETTMCAPRLNWSCSTVHVSMTSVWPISTTNTRAVVKHSRTQDRSYKSGTVPKIPGLCTMDCWIIPNCISQSQLKITHPGWYHAMHWVPASPHISPDTTPFIFPQCTHPWAVHLTSASEDINTPKKCPCSVPSVEMSTH